MVSEFNVLWRHTMLSVARILAIGFVLWGLSFGGAIVYGALEHAGFLQPTILIRPEFLPTTKEVVKQLLAGQATMATCLALAWAYWRYG